MARFLRQNVEASGYGAIVRVIERDTREVTLDDLDGERVEVTIAEHLSTWQVTEPQISVLNHVNRHLAEASAVRIPEHASNCVELVRSPYRFEDLVELRVHYFGFTGIKKPQLLSAPTLFRRVDFGLQNELWIDEDVDVVATRDGVVNGLRLTSPLQVFGLISFRSSDSLMPPVVVPLPEDLTVRAGEVVNVHLSYRCETSWSRVTCAAARRDSLGQSASEGCAATLPVAGAAG
jgi:predicted RNA methylase